MTCSRKEKIEILIMRILPLRQSAHHQYTIESQRQNMMKDKEREKARIRRKRRRGGGSSINNTIISITITNITIQIRSNQINRSVVSDSLQPHESQHARPPCPTPTPGVHWDSRPSSQWCHPAISSSVVPFCSCPQSFQHQSLFQWINPSHEVAKVLEFQL